MAGISAWQFTGLSFIVMIAGLQSLPEEVLEAARMDGAGAWRSFWRVMVPLMSPDDLLRACHRHDPRAPELRRHRHHHRGTNTTFTHTNVLINYIYNLLNLYHDQGTAACVAIALFAITAVFTALQFRFLERRVHYGS